MASDSTMSRATFGSGALTGLTPPSTPMVRARIPPAALRSGEGNTGRIVPLPRLLLQPLPGGGQKLEHPGFLDRQYGLPVCEGSVVMVANLPRKSSQRLSTKREEPIG